MSKERFKNIELIRFLLALTIVFFHFFHAGKACFGKMFSDIKILNSLSNGSINGTLAVDMFFIIAGFFLFYTYKDMSIKDFFLKKIARLYPLVILFAGVRTLYGYFLLHTPHYLPHEQILRLLLIDNIGLNTVHSGITWYVSVLLWVSLFYFYCYKNFEKKHFNLFTTLIIIFCYSYLIHANAGNIQGHTTSWNYIYNAGVMRGLAGMGIGYLISVFYSSINVYKPKKFKKLLYTFVELFLLFFVFNNLAFHKINYYSNFIIILGFIGLFILFLLKRGFISKIFDCDFSSIIGKYSYSIFITHLLVIDLFKYKIWKMQPELVYNAPIFTIVYTIAISIIIAVLTYYLIEKPSTIYLNNIWFNKDNN